VSAHKSGRAEVSIRLGKASFWHGESCGALLGWHRLSTRACAGRKTAFMTDDGNVGMKYNVRSAGSGSTTLIFVHGFGCDQSDWDAQVDALSARYRVVTFDLPGHADVPQPEPVTVEALADVLCEVKASHSSGGTVLAGHSLGCRVVLEAFRRCPADVLGLILLDGSRMAAPDLEQAMANVRHVLRSVGVRAYFQQAFDGMLQLSNNAALRRHVLPRLEKIDSNFAEELVLNITRWDAQEIEPVLATVKVPILLLQSTHIDDTLQWKSMEIGTSNAWTDLVTQAVHGTEVTIVPQIGHFLQIEAPESVNREISRFAAGLVANNT
jgi:pimeloyl-ACP methyl ester carboxylesterase